MEKTIIIKPIITEATNSLNREEGADKQYVFMVHKDANKPEIKKEIEKMYGVNIKSIRTALYMGKQRSRYTKTGILKGRKNHFKKAFITLEENQSINFYENI